VFFKYKLRTGFYNNNTPQLPFRVRLKKEADTVNKGVFININSERISKIYIGEKCLPDIRTNKQTTADTSQILKPLP
jgi:hypothetical protein